MEDNRFFFMLMLIFVATLAYFFFTAPPPPPQNASSPPPTPPSSQNPSTEPGPEKPSTFPSPPSAELKPSVSGLLRNSVMEAQWHSKNGDILSLTLLAKKDDRYLYPEKGRKDLPLKLLDTAFNSYALRLLDKDGAPVFEGLWECKSRDERSVEFRAENDSLAVTKRIALSDNGYHFAVRLEFENKTSSEVLFDGLRLIVAASVEQERESKGYDYLLIARMRESLEVSEIPLSKADNGKPYKDDGAFHFCGMSNHYFVFLLLPDDSLTRETVVGALLEKVDSRNTTPEMVLNYSVSAVLGKIRIAPSGKTPLNFIFFVGPKDPDILDSSEYSLYGFKHVVSYGFFGFLSRLFLAILKGVHFLVGNWGIAIIILTLIVRGALYPISRRQQVSMLKYQQKMQVIQPEMEKLKKKYKDDKQKLNQEILKLMRKHGVSIFPAGGCLLMFLQIPVFIGLWQALNTSIHLRQASFCLWIDDLSQPDRLFKLGAPIPILGTPYINLLPILMIVAMVIQSYFQPKTAQAQQQKLMNYFMYIFLSLIFYSLPSGLVLYFLASTLVGILESRIIRKQLQAVADITASKKEV
ncbi:MAG: membrane protein insertase YidC [Planctomycetota bacterium]|nr:membrane protein insertase YidC [Planctomycetota bacterium]